MGAVRFADEKKLRFCINRVAAQDQDFYIYSPRQAEPAEQRRSTTERPESGDGYISDHKI